MAATSPDMMRRLREATPAERAKILSAKPSTEDEKKKAALAAAKQKLAAKTKPTPKKAPSVAPKRKRDDADAKKPDLVVVAPPAAKKPVPKPDNDDVPPIAPFPADPDELKVPILDVVTGVSQGNDDHEPVFAPGNGMSALVSVAVASSQLDAIMAGDADVVRMISNVEAFAAVARSQLVHRDDGDDAKKKKKQADKAAADKAAKIKEQIERAQRIGAAKAAAPAEAAAVLAVLQAAISIGVRLETTVAKDLRKRIDVLFEKSVMTVLPDATIDQLVADYNTAAVKLPTAKALADAKAEPAPEAKAGPRPKKRVTGAKAAAVIEALKTDLARHQAVVKFYKDHERVHHSVEDNLYDLLTEKKKWCVTCYHDAGTCDHCPQCGTDGYDCSCEANDNTDDE